MNIVQILSSFYFFIILILCTIKFETIYHGNDFIIIHNENESNFMKTKNSINSYNIKSFKSKNLVLS